MRDRDWDVGHKRLTTTLFVLKGFRVLFGRTLVFYGVLAAGIGFLSEGYRSVWLCVWRFCSFVCVAFGMPIARGAGIFSGSGQRLIFLILFFSTFFFRGYLLGGFFLYSLRFLWGLFDLNFGLGAPRLAGRMPPPVFFFFFFRFGPFVVVYDYGGLLFYRRIFFIFPRHGVMHIPP